jgi:hypothetical protein
MATRYTKQQAEAHKKVLEHYALIEELQPNKNLVGQLALLLLEARLGKIRYQEELEAYKSRSFFQAIWQDMFR